MLGFEFDWETIKIAADFSIQTVSAVGTLLIAYLVYQLSRSNAEFSRAEAARVRDIEINKLRLAMFEKRFAAAMSLRKAYADYADDDTNIALLLDRLLELRVESKALFDEPVPTMLDTLWDLSNKLHTLNRRVERLWDRADCAADGEQTRLEAAIDRLRETRQTTIDQMFQQTKLQT